MSNPFAVAVSLVALAGCGGGTTATGAKSETQKSPATVHGPKINEADLSGIVLTPEAEKRLGIETAPVRHEQARQHRSYAGEAMIPPGQVVTVTAPVAGTLATASPLAAGTRVSRGQTLFRLQPLAPQERDLRSGIDADVATARTRVETARTRAARARQLLADGVGTARARDDAEEELKLAETTLGAAQARLERLRRAPLDADFAVSIAAPRDGVIRQLHAAAGQSVAAGAALTEIAALDPVWIRVPVYAGEAAAVDRGAPAAVLPLASGPARQPRSADPVAAPPSADAQSATVDLFYRLTNSDLAMRPGEKLSVTLALTSRRQTLQVPWAAILYDIHGGVWVYENTAPRTYVRRRVELDAVSGGAAHLARGIAAGVRVVTSGAAELFGTEFGPGK